MKWYLPLLLMLCLAACREEEYFTCEQLDTLSILKEGTSYALTSDAGEVLVITINNRQLSQGSDRNAENGRRVMHDELRYRCTVQLGDATDNGEFFATSIQPVPTELNFDFGANGFSAEGFIETTHFHDTLTVNGIHYTDVFRHHTGTAFSKEHGIIRAGLSRANEYIQFDR